MNKNSYFVLSVVAILLASSIYVAYAFLSNDGIYAEMPVSFKVPTNSAIVTTYTGPLALYLDINVSDLGQMNVGNTIDASGNMTIRYTTDGTPKRGFVCDYYITYTPSEVFTSSNDNELKISGIMDSTTIFDEDLKNFSTLDQTYTLYHGTYSTNNASNTVQVITLKYSLYNLDVDQSDITEKYPSGVIDYYIDSCSLK